MISNSSSSCLHFPWAGITSVDKTQKSQAGRSGLELPGDIKATHPTHTRAISTGSQPIHTFALLAAVCTRNAVRYSIIRSSAGSSSKDTVSLGSLRAAGSTFETGHFGFVFKLSPGAKGSEITSCFRRTTQSLQPPEEPF